MYTNIPQVIHMRIFHHRHSKQSRSKSQSSYKGTLLSHNQYKLPSEALHAVTHQVCVLPHHKIQSCDCTIQ